MDVNGPMDRLHIDLVGPFPRSNGYAWILMCIDAYSRYLIAVPLRDKSAVVVANAIMGRVFCNMWIYRQIITTLGTKFQKELLQHLSHLLNVTKLQTTRRACTSISERADVELRLRYAARLQSTSIFLRPDLQRVEERSYVVQPIRNLLPDAQAKGDMSLDILPDTPRPAGRPTSTNVPKK